MLGRFKREHPRVKLQISSGNTEEVVDRLL
jgi:hypothetical protein